MEEALEHDVPALLAAFRAFNRWLDEDWGFDYQDRIFAAPYITLADVDWAVEELEWALDARRARHRDARGAGRRAPTGRRSLGDPAARPVLGALDEAGITVAHPLGRRGLRRSCSTTGARTASSRRSATTPLQLAARPLADQRHDGRAHLRRRVRPASRTCASRRSRPGSDWVAPLLQASSRRRTASTPYAFAEDPVETFRQHVWVSPYYEDDLPALRDAIGADHILFGSDFPHAEGLADPIAFVHDLEGFTDDEIRLIMRENGFALTRPRVAVAS